MDLIYSFDPERFYLGTLCKRGHRWPGTQQSLRRIYKDKNGRTVNTCFACASPRDNWLLKFLDNKASGVPDGFRLGALCHRGHEWNNTGFCLRRAAGRGGCTECEKINHRKPDARLRQNTYRLQNRDRLNAEAKARMARLREDPAYVEIMRERTRRSNAKRRATVGRPSRAKGLEDLWLPPGYTLDPTRAKICKQLLSEGNPRELETLIPLIEQRFQLETLLGPAINAAGKSPSVAQLVEAEQRLYWKTNPNSYREFCRQRARDRAKWRHMTDLEYRLYHRQKSKRRKAIIKHIIGNQLTGKQVRQRFAQFDHRCAYCGATGEDLHIEHVVPISKGGPHALGNIIPACQSCNFSKKDHEVESWYRSQPFFSNARWAKIKRILSWDKASTGQLSLL